MGAIVPFDQFTATPVTPTVQAAPAWYGSLDEANANAPKDPENYNLTGTNTGQYQWTPKSAAIEGGSMPRPGASDAAAKTGTTAPTLVPFADFAGAGTQGDAGTAGAAPEPLSTGKYIAGKALQSALGEGDQLVRQEARDNPYSYTPGANPTLTPEATSFLARPSAVETANQQLFGRKDLGPAPNTFARYAGAAAGDVAGNPFGALGMPGGLPAKALATMGASIGSEGANQLTEGMDIPWWARMVAQLVGGGLGGAGAAMSPSAVRGTVRLMQQLDPAVEAGGARAATGVKIAPKNVRQGIDYLGQRLDPEINYGGVTEPQMLEAPTGQPTMLADQSRSMRAAAEQLVNKADSPGKYIIEKALTQRQDGMGERLTQLIASKISNRGSAYRTAQELSQHQRAVGGPLFERAMQGGSMAPLESQFRANVQSLTAQLANAVKSLKALAARGAQMPNARGAAAAPIRAEYEQLSAQVERLKQARENAIELFNRAKRDGSMNAPGAVWSPYVEQVLNDPIAKQGLAKGLEIQRIEALAERRPMNATEHAIVGDHPDGTPKVAAVPNMRTLQAVKIGLDEMVEAYRDKLTGILHLDQRGRAINKLRAEFVKELKALNPDYAAANEAWAGDAAAKNALSLGERFRSLKTEQVADLIEGMTASEKEFFLQGAADSLINSLEETASTSGNAARKLLGNAKIRKQLRPLFKSDADYDETMNAIEAAHREWQTMNQAMGNSRTAFRFSQNAIVNPKAPVIPHFLTATGAFVTGEPIVAATEAAKGTMNVGKRFFGGREGPSKETEAAAGNLLTETDPARRAAITRAVIAAARRKPVQFGAPAARSLIPSANQRLLEQLGVSGQSDRQ